jgi:3-oxoacyl-[acyl-carrier protein] reductase
VTTSELQVRPHWSRARAEISGDRARAGGRGSGRPLAGCDGRRRRQGNRGAEADPGHKKFGGVDIYVSYAARRLYKDFFEITDEDWHYHLNQQLTASWYQAKAFVPGMRDRGWGRVVHINGEDGWLGGWTPDPPLGRQGRPRTLTKSLASGLGQYGITVKDVSPGFIDTIRDMETHPEVTRGRTEDFLPAIPIRRQPTPEEMAWACAFLCSTRSAAITGAVIHVNGGEWMFG